jgi:hypothetical protein
MTHSTTAYGPSRATGEQVIDESTLSRAPKLCTRTRRMAAARGGERLVHVARVAALDREFGQFIRSGSLDQVATGFLIGAGAMILGGIAELH